MTEEERKKQAEHNQVFRDDVKTMGLEAFVCTHIESGERKIFSDQSRTIEMGESRVAFLCSLCSGQLVESMVGELIKKTIDEYARKIKLETFPPIADTNAIQEQSEVTGA